MTIQDLRNMMTGAATQFRNVDQIDMIIMHWSGTAGGDAVVFERNAARDLGWHTGPYHEVLTRDNVLQLAYHPNVQTNGAGIFNRRAYHVCYVGNTAPTAAMRKTLIARVRELMNQFNLSIDQVYGHGEVAATQCPGIDMGAFRRELATSGISNNQRTHTVVSGDTLSALARHFGTTVEAFMGANTGITNANAIRVGQVLNIPTTAPSTGGTSDANNNSNNEETFVVAREMDGFATAADAAANRNRRTTVAPGTYFIFNQSQGMINVTTRPEQPGSWINPNNQDRFFPIPSNHNLGLVDSLNSIGVDSSSANRTRIAHVNGINPYNKTAAQNNQLLTLLRQGRLVRP